MQFPDTSLPFEGALFESAVPEGVEEEVDRSGYAIRDTEYTITLYTKGPGEGLEEFLYFKPESAIGSEDFIPAISAEASRFLDSRKSLPNQKSRSRSALFSGTLSFLFIVGPLAWYLITNDVESLARFAPLFLFVFPLLAVTSASRARDIFDSLRSEWNYLDFVRSVTLPSYLSRVFDFYSLSFSDTLDVETVRFLNEEAGDNKGAARVYKEFITRKKEQSFDKR